MSLDQFPSFTRRRWVQHAAPALFAATLPNLPLFAQQAPVTPSRSLDLPKLYKPSERESTDAPKPEPPGERVGFAVVGLGRLALEQVLPAFGECKRAKLTALVSGEMEKAREVARRYGVPEKNLYTYQTYDRLRDNPDVDVIYIILPNGMHREYTVRGAQAGKHILSEKPMANNSRECEEMIAACRKAGRKLMIAYRMQYEPYNREVVRMVRAKELGAVKQFTAENTQAMANPEQWRLKKALAGGGALPDIGIYCLNAARFITGEEPVEVRSYIHSTPGDVRFREVEELVSFTLQFPSGMVAHCSTSYDVHNSRRYRVGCSDGWIDLDPAFAYEGLRMKVGRKSGEKAEGQEERSLQQKNQFALEMDHMAQCVREDKQPHTPGEEGLQDHRLMEAIYEAAQSGRVVKLPTVSKLDSTRGPAPQQNS